MSGCDPLQRLHQGSGGRTELFRYLREVDGEFVLAPTLRGSTLWHIHNLATDASFGEFQAIVAPRPLNEFTAVSFASAQHWYLTRAFVLSAFYRLTMGVRHEQLHLATGSTAVLPSYGAYGKIG